MRFSSIGVMVVIGALGACGGQVQDPNPNPNPSCGSNGVSAGDSCSVKGEQCWSNEPLYCTDIPPSCTCDGSTWQCQVYKCPACPAAGTMVDGDVCSETRFDCPSTMTCAGETVTTYCSCMAGTWSCTPACGG